MAVLGCVVLLWGLAAKPASGQSLAYPAKPVRVVIAYPAGGSLDINARIMNQKLTEAFRQQFFIDNRPGASGIIGSEFVARSAPDGHTLLFVPAGSHTTNPSMMKKLPYDTLRDFAAISNFVNLPLVFVVPSSMQVKTIKDLVTLAKARPGDLNAAIGYGNSGHLALELFMSMTKTRISLIPYKGNAPALTDTVAGHMSLMVPALQNGMTFIKAGRLRALAVTSQQRASLFPDVPTVSEAGLKGYEASVYNGVVAPAGTPRDIVDRLSAEIARIARSADVQKLFAEQAVHPIGSTPDEFGAFIAADIQRWAKVIRDAGIKPE